jgi:hypothetical protein
VTLETAYDDSTVVEVANVVGKQKGPAYFTKLAHNYQNVWNPVTQFMSCHVEASTQSSDRGGSLLLFDVPRPLADYEDLALRRIKLTAFRTRLYFGASPSISRALAASRSHAWIEAVSASCLGTLRQLKSHTC